MDLELPELYRQELGGVEFLTSLGQESFVTYAYIHQFIYSSLPPRSLHAYMHTRIRAYIERNIWADFHVEKQGLSTS